LLIFLSCHFARDAAGNGGTRAKGGSAVSRHDYRPFTRECIEEKNSGKPTEGDFRFHSNDSRKKEKKRETGGWGKKKGAQ